MASGLATAVGLVTVLFAACEEPPGRGRVGVSALSHVVFGVEHDSDVLLLSARGATLHRFDGHPGGPDDERVSYRSPALAPDGRSVAVVRCMGLPEPFGEVGLTLAGGCALVRVNLTNRDETLLLATPGPLDSPVWDPSGRSLTVIRGRELVSLGAADGAVIWSFAVNMLEASPALVDELRSYLRWDDSGRDLYLVATRAEPDVHGLKAVGRVDERRRDVEWIQLPFPQFLYGKHVVHREGEPHHGLPPDAHPGFVAVFGSVSNPVLRPLYSADRRFYSYLTKREGLFASGWVEGYDWDADRTWKVKNLWRALYLE